MLSFDEDFVREAQGLSLTSLFLDGLQYFNEESGTALLRKLSVPEFLSVELETQNKSQVFLRTLMTYPRYYCLATTNALIKYIEFVQNVVFASGTIRFVFEGPEKTMLIGRDTHCVLSFHVQILRLPRSLS
jgi:DNA mismatch repair protein MSH4